MAGRGTEISGSEMSAKRNSKKPVRKSRKKKLARAPSGRPRTRLELMLGLGHSPKRKTAAGKKRGGKRPSGGGWRLFRGTAYWGFVASIWVALILGSLTAYLVSTLPDPTMAGLDKRPPNVTVLATDGTILAERGMTRGHIRVNRLPPYLIDAVIATEDRRFHDHFGVDPVGLARALYRNYRAGAVVEGGSTITQQLAKNLFLTPARTIERKFQEMLLALWLEMKYSKKKILELYLNRVYFGAGSYGVEAAAKRYFGKSARQVTLSEAALLAGLLKAPSRYAPTRNARRAEERAGVVIAAMVDSGMLKPKLAMAALAEPARVRNPSGLKGYEYALDWVAELLPGTVGDSRHDLIVETTIDAKLQRKAQQVVSIAMASNGGFINAEQAAAVILRGNGAVAAIVGGASYKASQFNRAIKSLRQPGSAFKPVVYLAALESGLSPNSVFRDAPVSINGWRPANYDGKYAGDVTLRDALARSLNTVAVRLVMEVGRWRVIRTARRLGISSPLHNNPSIALGTAETTLLELTSSYVPFANGGQGIFPHIIRRVRTNRGKVLFDHGRQGPGRIVAAPYVAGMNNMMSETLRSGTGKKAALPGRPAAGKTGTSQNFRDAWFVGYTANYTAGVWVGNDDSSPMKKVTGGGLPAEIWQQLMLEAHKGVPVAALPGATTPAKELSQGWAPKIREEVVSPPSRIDEPFLRRVFGGIRPSG